MAKQNRPTYQELQDELEVILGELQREDIDVDEAMKKYEKGLEITKQLESYLESAENTVKEIQSKIGRAHV